jgi:hypothetical protein
VAVHHPYKLAKVGSIPTPSTNNGVNNVMGAYGAVNTIDRDRNPLAPQE